MCRNHYLKVLEKILRKCYVLTMAKRPSRIEEKYTSSVMQFNAVDVLSVSQVIPAQSLAAASRTENVSRVISRTIEVFGNEEKAKSWLSKSRHQFYGKSPLEMLSTQAGVEAVENLLGQIEHGIFA